MDVYASPFTVEMKSPGDPVTMADKRANELLCREIAASFPGEAIVAEEDAPRTADEVKAMIARERVFYVDPLDGTREFAARRAEFSVMIGVALQGRATLGVLVMPVTGEALMGDARVLESALIEAKDGTRAALRVTAQKSAANSTMMVSRSRRPRLVGPLAERLAIANVVPCGSVGVKVARVAMAQADLYVHGGGGVSSWDLCGPEAVLAAAGGRVTALDGSQIDYAAELVHTRGFVGTNGALHDTVLQAIQSINSV
ncbi:MAG: 3'(2'),5'-bisphosphate nucleotidase CysQ [Polyangiaceae bacterium]|nr:3'(2'),5'-bisphosphate nucleotidase CysQ [Polyangiaceae bacterium]